MLNFIKKLISIYSIFLIFNLTFVNSAQADPELAGRVEVATGGSDELMTELNISKNINGFDIKLRSNYSLMSQIPIMVQT